MQVRHSQAIVLDRIQENESRHSCRLRGPLGLIVCLVHPVVPQGKLQNWTNPSPLAHDSYLIDPVSSICLFQRLSHACLSISELVQ